MDVWLSCIWSASESTGPVCARRPSHCTDVPPTLHQDDTFEDSSIFSVGSMGSAATNGGHGRLPSSPSTLGAATQSDEEEEDDELRGRWGNDGVVVGGGEKHDNQQGHHVSNNGMVWHESISMC